MKRFALLTLVFGLVLTTACSEDEGSSSKQGASQKMLPTSNGSHHELLIFCDQDPWSRGAGLAVAEGLAAPISSLLQKEPRFHISQLPHASANRLVKRGKSILVLKIIPDSTRIYAVKNVWADPQMVVEVIAPDLATMQNMLRNGAEDIARRYENHNLEVLRPRMRRSAKKNLPPSFKDLGIERMLLPLYAKTTLVKDQMTIMRYDTKNSLQYYVFTRRPATDLDLSPTRMTAERNKILAQYFEGQQDGSHLATESRIAPTFESVTLGRDDGMLVQGMFRTEGGFGGGPYMSVAVLDEAQGEMVTVDCILFAPGADKRKLLMEFEVMLRSLRLAQP